MSGAAELVVDVGHSRVKWGCCQDGRLVDSSVRSCELDDPGSLLTTLERESIGALIWSPQSHGATVDRMGNEFRALGVSCRTVTTGALDLPVAAAYPDLGTDRWLALQWPWLQTRRALCIIDCGTAVTVDAVDGQGRHLGGWIMAGLRMLRVGMAHSAPRLPTPVSEATIASGPATDSAQAISRGFRLQLIGGIQSALAELQSTLGPDFACWLTGGDAPVLAAALTDAQARPVNHDPHLVLRGLALAGSRP